MGKIVDDYAGVYGGFLTPEEQVDLGKFAASLLDAKMSSNKDKIQDLIKNAALEIDNYEDFEAVMGVFDWLEKEAADSKISPAIGNVLSAAAAGFAMAPAVASFARHIKRKDAMSKSFEQILKDYPNLKSDPNTPRYFKLIADFAPDVAANPLIAGNVMETFRKLGPGAITPTAINEILGLQGRISMTAVDAAKAYGEPMSRALEIGAGRAAKLEDISRKDRDIAQKASAQSMREKEMGMKEQEHAMRLEAHKKRMER